MHKHFKIKKKQVHDLLFPWLPVPVTDCTTGVNGTNETQNDYSGRCLIIHVENSEPLQHLFRRLHLYS